MAGAAILPAFPVDVVEHVLQGNAVHQVVDALVDALPQRVHRTAVGMLARLGDAAGRRQRASPPQDRAYGDIFRLVRQRISALCSADGKHQPRLAQRRDELLEVGFGDACRSAMHLTDCGD